MGLPRCLLIAGLVLLPSIATADVAPDVDPYQACEGLALAASCSVSTFDEFYDGTCVEEACPNDPMTKCKVCREAVAATTGGSTGPSGTGGPDTSSTGGPDSNTTGTTGTGATGPATSTGDGPTTGGTAATDASSSSGDAPKDDGKGCSCRSSDASGGLLALLGLTLVRRRRRGA